MKCRISSALVLTMVLFCLQFARAQAQRTVAPSERPLAENPPQNASQPYQAADAKGASPAAEWTLPAGTLISVRTTQYLASNRNRTGDRFLAVLDQPLVAQGWVLARRGQTAEGRVALVQAAGRTKGVSQLGLELTQLILVDGRQIPVRTQLIQSSGGTARGRDAGGIAAASGTGAMIGAAAGGGAGAAIGAAAGAMAGVIGVLSTRGPTAELYPETILTFRLEEPVVLSAQQGRHVFQPVTAADYSSPSQANPPRRYHVDPYIPAAPYYYPPAYYYAPYPYYGFAGYYGFGFAPRFYAYPGYHVGPRYYRHH